MMLGKLCTGCGEIKPRSCYYKTSAARTSPDGLRGKCRSCTNAIQYRWQTQTANGRAYSLRSRETRAEKEKAGLGIPRERMRIYQRTAIGKIKNDPAYRNRRYAYHVVDMAVRRGVISKPSHCECCGATKRRLEAHHYLGYSKAVRLSVVFLCKDCHIEAPRRDALCG